MTRSGRTRQGFIKEVALDLVLHHWATSYLTLWVSQQDSHMIDRQVSKDSEDVLGWDPLNAEPRIQACMPECLCAVIRGSMGEALERIQQMKKGCVVEGSYC